jgi:hypothetical protein
LSHFTAKLYANMLLNFTVENFRSFRDPVELSFVATRPGTDGEFVVDSTHAKHGVLPVVGLWGANASGKTNLLKALECFRYLVAASQTGGTEWVPPAVSFAHDGKPTRMVANLLLRGDVRVEYEVRFDGARILFERLCQWDTHRRRSVFVRDAEDAASAAWAFGRGFGSARKQIQDATRANALFLSTGAYFNHPVLKDVSAAILRGIRGASDVGLSGFPLFHAGDPLLDPSLTETLRKLLVNADVGITDFEFEKRAHRAPSLVAEAEPSRLVMFHRGPEGTTFAVDPAQESRGTWNFLLRGGDIVRALRDGTLLVMDELETSLHPDLCGKLIGLFTNQKTNPNGAQLLFSTHSRALLTTLRADEIVLVDKSSEGVSSMRAASDYKLRARDNVVRLHAEGRLAGVPVVGDLEQVVAELHAPSERNAKA